MLLLVIGDDIAAWYAYVGSTVKPTDRLRSHKRKPTEGVRKVLARIDKSVGDLLFVPLQTVSGDLSHAAEVDWTVLVETVGMHKMNCFGTYGNPAQSRYFWRRKHAQKCRSSADTFKSSLRTDAAVAACIDLSDE